MKLSRDFYLNDTLAVAKKLLGKYLVTRTDGVLTVGKIVETEAYLGPRDKACHSYKSSPSGRTNVMFGDGGYSYVYLIYGMHCCFNVVTRPQGEAEAVLIRALEPLYGLPQMQQRRKTDKVISLCSGPGKLCQAMGIDRSHYGADLLGDDVFIMGGENIPTSQIAATPRIGVDYAGEDGALPYRFVVKTSEFLSVKYR